MRPITADLHMAQLMPLPLHSLSLASVKSGLVLPFYMVCLSVCVLGTPVNCVIMAEPIAMPFGGHTEVGPWNHELDGGPDPPKEGVLLRGHVLDTSWTVNSSSLCACWKQPIPCSRSVTQQWCVLLRPLLCPLVSDYSKCVNFCRLCACCWQTDAVSDGWIATSTGAERGWPDKQSDQCTGVLLRTYVIAFRWCLPVLPSVLW